MKRPALSSFLKAVNSAYIYWLPGRHFTRTSCLHAGFFARHHAIPERFLKSDWPHRDPIFFAKDEKNHTRTSVRPVDRMLPQLPEGTLQPGYAKHESNSPLIPNEALACDIKLSVSAHTNILPLGIQTRLFVNQGIHPPYPLTHASNGYLRHLKSQQTGS